MEQDVYADLYVLVNAGMDYLCLLLTAALSHRVLPKLRALFASLLGGGYALAALLLGWSGIFGVVSDLFCGGLLCFIAFAEKGLRPLVFLKLFGVQLFISVLLGGSMTLLFDGLNRLQLPLDTLDRDGISVWLFAALALIAGLFTYRGGKWFGISGKSKTVTVRAKVFGKTVTLRGFVDSGNRLKDPVTGKNVIVADRNKLKGVFPEALLKPAGSPEAEEWLSDWQNARRVHWIPAKTATGSGILLAVKPEKIEIGCAKESYAADYLLAVGDCVNIGNGADALVPLE